jgi:hypothetical protein
VPGSPYRWAILAVCVAGFMQTHVHRVGFAPLIPVGVLTDRLGARRVMLGCMGRELPRRLQRLRGLRGGGPRHRHVCAGNRPPARGMMSGMEILDPVGSTSAASRTLAPRPASLAGAVIGVLDNSKPNARVLLEGVARALAQKVGARDVKIWGKPGASIGATAAVLDEIAAQCGAVLTASAD